MKDCLWCPKLPNTVANKTLFTHLGSALHWPGKKLTRGNLPQSTGRSKNPRAHNFLRQPATGARLWCEMPATVTTDRVRVAGVDVLANIVMSGAKLFFLSPK